MERTQSMVRLEARQKMIELTAAEQMTAQMLDGASQQLRSAGFHFDSDPEEAWLRGFKGSDFVLVHRRLPLAVTSSKTAARALESRVQVLEVTDYEAFELSIDPESLDLFDWHAETYPADPDGINPARFSADELFYATV